MNKVFFISATVALFIALSASAQVMRDGNERTLLTKDAGIEGSRYFSDKWEAGKVVTTNGNKLDDVFLKYDIYENKVIFKTDKNETEQAFTDPVKTFVFKGPPARNFSNGFPSVANQKAGSYYEVLSSGKKTLLKYYGKALSEIKTYGSSETVKKFEEIESYYVFSDDKMILIKKNKSAVLAQLNDKADKVDTFLKTTNINYKNDDDLKKLFDYYNGI